MKTATNDESLQLQQQITYREIGEEWLTNWGIWCREGKPPGPDGIKSGPCFKYYVPAYGKDCIRSTELCQQDNGYFIENLINGLIYDLDERRMLRAWYALESTREIPEACVRHMLEKHGLEITEPDFCNRIEHLKGQIGISIYVVTELDSDYLQIAKLMVEDKGRRKVLSLNSESK